MSKYKIYECQADIYDTYFYVAFTKSDFKNHLRAIKMPDANEKISCAGLTVRNNSSLAMYIDIKQIESEIMNTIAHEAFHMADFIFKIKGLLFDNVEVTNEHAAYLIGHITRQVYKALEMQRGKK